MSDIAAQFPDLFTDIYWEGANIHARFDFTDTAPDLISNVNVVPYIGDQWVILRLDNGRWEIPGGTLEPDETYLETIHREVMEEAGARLLSFEPLGAWYCQSDAPQPYRPHLPHPIFYRFAGYGEIELVGKPLNPPDAEQVVSVEQVSLETAVERFRSINRADLADLYRFAAYRRSLSTPST
jgi:8-oxo-dGTP diphosphatase